MARKNLLKGFKRPKGITFEHSEVNPNYGRFIAYPFERGYGVTIGNTLRRILLSSLQGYAITAVRVTSYGADNTPHLITNEFQAIPEVVEDTPDIINNLKQVQLQLDGEAEEKLIVLEVKGERRVKAGDLETETGIRVINKDLHLFTTTNKANLELEVQVDLGRGYVPAERNERYVEVIGTLPMDATFSPIRKVKYAVEDTRVGQRTDYDKLVLEIWTNGTVAPEDALAESAKIAKDNFTVFINFEEEISTGDDEVDEEEEQIRALLDTPVEELELSVRSSNCLRNANIRSIGDLTRRSEEEIAKTRNFGKKSLQEIKSKLEERGLTFGMTDYSHLKKKLAAERSSGKDGAGLHQQDGGAAGDQGAVGGAVEDDGDEDGDQ
jgi:DNA-directed RNA polymerase subunit alpha